MYFPFVHLIFFSCFKRYIKKQRQGIKEESLYKKVLSLNVHTLILFFMKLVNITYIE